jgi:hypothetical protein
MKRPVAASLILLGLLLCPLTASAAQVRAFVAEFSISAPEPGDLKITLKRLLASRLSGDGIATMDTASEADVIVSGSYTQLGKMFSIDAVVKTTAGTTLTSAFEQGDSQDSLIPAVGKISAKLRAEILKVRPQSSVPVAASAPPAVSSPAIASPAAPNPATVTAAPAPEPEIIRAAPSTSSWMSQRITGAQRSLAPAGAEREYFIADGSTLRLYRQDKVLTLVAEAEIPGRCNLISVDSFSPDSGGKTMAVVTIMDGEDPSSRIYTVEKNKLQLVAKDLPYLFRTLALNGGPVKLYAQQVGRIEDYYGDLYEASFTDGSIKLKNPIKLPHNANIFNFNTFRDQSGATYSTVFSDSGYLIIYSDKGEELWRTSVKLGGSETYFLRRDSDTERTTGVPFRPRFIDQRISVTENGEIIVPQNGGFFVVGNSRSYSKYSVVSFTWNGSSLEEHWRTAQSPNYLADYFYRPGTKELVMLEVVQEAGPFSKGGSALRVLRTE